MNVSIPTPIELLLPLVRQAPPWLVLATLAGLVSASAFFVIAGRGFRSLPTYLVLGAAVAPLSHLAGASLALGSGGAFGPGPLTVGEVDLLVLAGVTWGMLSIARLLRL